MIGHLESLDPKVILKTHYYTETHFTSVSVEGPVVVIEGSNTLTYIESVVTNLAPLYM